MQSCKQDEHSWGERRILGHMLIYSHDVLFWPLFLDTFCNSFTLLYHTSNILYTFFFNLKLFDRYIPAYITHSTSYSMPPLFSTWSSLTDTYLVVQYRWVWKCPSGQQTRSYLHVTNRTTTPLFLLDHVAGRLKGYEKLYQYFLAVTYQIALIFSAYNIVFSL